MLAVTLDICYSDLMLQCTFRNKDERLRMSRDFHGRVVTVVIDGTEQQVQISRSKFIEQACYSGKKNLHTFTLMIAVSPNGRIYYVSPSYTGSKNDLKVYSFTENQIHLHLDQDEYIMADGGYQSLPEYHPAIIIIHQGANQKQLTEMEQNYNNEVSSIRTVVENVIAHVKKWKICRYTLRLKGLKDLKVGLEQHHKIFVCCAALVDKFVAPIRSLDHN